MEREQQLAVEKSKKASERAMEKSKKRYFYKILLKLLILF